MRLLTSDEFLRRHEYCIYPAEARLQRQLAALEGRTPKNPYQPVCDHPEDGYCGVSVTPDQLAEVNRRLQNTQQVKV